MSAPAAGASREPYEYVHLRGRRVVLARGVPVLEDDAYVLPVPAEPSLGEPGVVAFTRDLGRWLSRLFDRPSRPWSTARTGGTTAPTRVPRPTTPTSPGT